jgi:hypothetical protein
MHREASEFVAHVAAILPAGLRVVEFGSRDVNGSIRGCFAGAASYLGIDAMPGPGVNLVMDAAWFDGCLGLGRFDVVVCCETLEHARDPGAICRAAYNVLTPGGVFIATAANEKREPHSAIDGGKLRDGEPYQPITRSMLTRDKDPDDGLLGQFRAVLIREFDAHGDIYALAIK